MSKQNVPLFAFNRGEIGRHALGRVDAEQLRLAAEQQVNFLPMTLGPMMLRPGLGYIGAVRNNQAAVIRPFIFATNDTAVLEFTEEILRIWVDDALVTALSVSTSITNGDMGSSVGWTLTASTGATSSIANGVLTMNIQALGSSAIAERSTTVGAADIGVEHRVRIVVNRGPVAFRIGSASGTDDFFAATTLGTGTHSIAFTPTADFYVRFTALRQADAVVDSITVESAGTVELPTPWTAAQLPTMRHVQSGDIVYCAQADHQQRQIERRDNNSWSVVLYEPVGGPYQAKPDWAEDIFLTPNVTFGGTGTLTASSAFFTADDVNSIIAIDSFGVNYKTKVAGERTTDTFEVNGANTYDRFFSYTIAGTWTGSVGIFRSVVGPDEGYTKPTAEAANITSSFDDSNTHANRTVWYKFGFADGDYTSGAAEISITYPTGPKTRGQARIIGYVSSTSVNIEEFDSFLVTDITPIGSVPPPVAGYEFRIADWSDAYGWPSAVEIHDGRLWWGGRDKLWGSISDDYTNFEETFEGDAGPINRSFGYGPFANVNWLCSLNRLIAGRDSSCVSIRSSNFDAPLTPIDFTMRDSTSYGSAELPAVKIDKSAIYVDKSGRRVFELRYDVDAQDYIAHDLTAINPDMGLELFADLAVQRQLDTRVHLVRGDGKVAVLTYERGNVEAWWKIETDGVVESVCVLPGSLEDNVYYVVKRTKYTLVGGVPTATTVRYLEKFARQDECVGAELNKQADSYITYTGAATTTVTGLSHLEGKEVVCWGNGKDLGNYTVSGGSISVSEAVESAVVGLEYTGKFTSAKLSYAAQAGTALFQKKRAVQLGLMLLDTHYQGLEFGQDFTTMDNLPQVEEGTTTPSDTIWSDFDAPMVPLPGRWQTDSRLCLRATAPRPCTVGAAAIDIQTYEKV